MNNGGEPEISLTDPASDWQVGTLPSGRQYFFRPTDDEDDPEVRLLSDLSEEPSEVDTISDWKVGTLPSGRQHLWRDNLDDPDDPEIKMYSEGSLDSGQPFWYDDEGTVVLNDPFAGPTTDVRS